MRAVINMMYYIMKVVIQSKQLRTTIHLEIRPE